MHFISRWFPFNARSGERCQTHRSALQGRPQDVECYFWIDDAKGFYDELTKLGAKIDYHLCKKDYGCLEFGIQDVDGYHIAFGQVIDEGS